MAVDHIRYDLLTQQALRDVIRKVLADTAKKGLLGDHHFSITFDTRLPGVRLSPGMRAQYPEEMTIILQHQFWDLSVTDEAFEVGLSFGGIAERLRVPFTAVKSFFDPSVQFGLQFQSANEIAAPSADAETPRKPDNTATPLPASPGSALTVPESKVKEAGDEPDKPEGGGEVVRLDRFRKK